MSSSPRRTGFSLLELLAVALILGVLAVLILPRITGSGSEAERNACFAQQGDIELQVQLWLRENGSLPASNLSNIGSDTTYFPSGLPSCPVDGSSYTIDSAGHVVGHTH